MRATQRFGDVIVRRALGATSGEIARLFFVESAVLGTAGGILGFAWLWRCCASSPRGCPPGCHGRR
ncbi:MAG: ABC transporter permease [Longimicrobiales bacterium]